MTGMVGAEKKPQPLRPMKKSLRLPHIIALYIVVQMFDGLLMRYAWTPMFAFAEPSVKAWVHLFTASFHMFLR